MDYSAPYLDGENFFPSPAAVMEIPQGFYEHYKGGIYYVLTVATQEATGRRDVIYKGKDGRVWSRPLEDFTKPGLVQWPPRDGPSLFVHRFTYRKDLNGF